MPLSARSRDSGIEFAIGWYLAALGVGVFIPRKGLGLYSILHAGAHAWLWGALLLIAAAGLVCASFSYRKDVRLAATGLAFVCWSVLAFLFVDASLWGAAMQAAVALIMLNTCIFNLLRVKP